MNFSKIQVRVVSVVIKSNIPMISLQLYRGGYRASNGLITNIRYLILILECCNP